MDSFSVVSLTTQCTNICHIAISASHELNALTDQLPESAAAARLAPRLLSFSDSLKEYGHAAGELQRSLERSSVISPNLQTELTTRLGACQGSAGLLNKQLMRLDSENATGLVWGYLVLQRDLLVAYTQLFVYFDELLAL
jgi:hypothetical protein